MRARFLVLLLAVGLLAGACGDDDGGAFTPEEQALADALFADIQADSEQGDPIQAEGARCIADGMVATLGVDRLAELGVTASDVGESGDAFRGMTDSEMNRMGDLGLECVDVEAAFIEEMVASGLSRDSSECLSGRLADTEFFRASIIAGMREEDFAPDQDSALIVVFITAAQECLTDDEFALFFGG